MSDPQNEETTNEVVSADIETNDSIPASETGSDVQAESNEQVEVVDEVEVAKQKANDAFNKQYGKNKQLERELKAERERIAQFEQAEQERQALLVSNVPPMPDSFDDDYDEKVKKRDEALLAKAQFDARNKFALEQQQLTQQQEAQARQAEVNKSIESYAKRASELGITGEQLQIAGQKVASYGLSEELTMHIVNDSDGALITKHLAGNEQDGFKLANMNPYEAGIFLNDIKQKASALKPKQSSTPPPATNLQGNGADPDLGKYKYLEGATFE